MTDAGIVGPITWEHLMRRCGGITPSARSAAAEATVEVVPTVEDIPIADVSSMGIEYSPNFAALDMSEDKFVEESLGTVEPVVIESSTATVKTAIVKKQEINLSNLMMYLLIRHTKK